MEIITDVTKRNSGNLRKIMNMKKCPLCNKNFFTKSAYESHVLQHKNCNKCKKKFNNVDNLLDHIKKCKLKDTRNIDKKTDEKDKYFRKLSDEENENESNGSMTHDDSENNDQEIRKLKHVRRKRAEIIAEYFCDICSKGFTRKYDMQRHRAKKHQNAPEPPKARIFQNKNNSDLLQRCQITGPEGKQVYKCEICNKLINFKYNFIRHQTIHTGVRPYFCHICGKSYTFLGTLTRHIREFHQRVKNHSCEICGKKFAAKASLDEHQNIHTNERPFVCDVCGKSFKQKSSLHIHKVFHLNVFRFSCSVCGKKFRRARDLKVHSWLHTGHRPYACEVCGSMFRLSQDLKRHSNVHNKILMESVCVDCGATFNHQRQMINHMKIHQVKVKEENVDVSNVK